MLDRARAARRTELAAAAELLVTAAEWADLHPVPRGGQPAGWGEVDLHGEGLVPLAGEGTPQVAEFAPAELAGHLGISHDAGRQLVGDALELRHRLPRLFDLVLAGTVPAWRARQAAALTTRLTPEMVTWVDKMLACDPQHLSVPRVRRIIEETILHYDPDRAAADEQAALAARHVTLVHDSGPATTEVHMRLDTLDALHLDDTLADLATRLRRLGDTDPPRGPPGQGGRRARRPATGPGPARHRRARRAATGGGGWSCSCTSTSTDLADPDPGRRRGDRTARGGHPGPARGWLGRPDLAGITVRPVLDLHTPEAVDRHDPPAWMRHAALLADATCVFPGCTRDSRGCDLDHIDAYVPIEDGGPPGQTRLANLAPLCRTHHRLKTHGGWSYQRLADNHYLWTTPTGDLLAVHTRRRTPTADDPDRPTPAGTPSRRAKGMPSPGPGGPDALDSLRRRRC